MFKHALYYLLAFIFALLSFFKDRVLNFVAIPKRALDIIIIILLFFVVFYYPFLSKIEQKTSDERLKRMEEKIDQIKGTMEFKPTQGNAEVVPQKGTVKKIFGLEKEGTIVFWYTPERIENIIIPGKIYLFDLFSRFSNENRISMYLETISYDNYLVVQVFDARRNSYLIKHNISGWKDKQKHFIALTFSVLSKELKLYLDGVVVEEIQIGQLNLESVGPNLYLHSSYERK